MISALLNGSFSGISATLLLLLELSYITKRKIQKMGVKAN